MVEMTLEEIERRLGQKIKLVSEKTPKKYKKVDILKIDYYISMYL